VHYFLSKAINCFMLSMTNKSTVQRHDKSIDGLLGCIHAELLKPRAGSHAVVHECLKKIRGLGGTSIQDAVRVECLLSAAQFFYVNANAAEGLAPASEAVFLAQSLQDDGLLRKAHTFHGILQADTGNVPVAIEHLSQALELAIKLEDRHGELIVWTNIGLALLFAAQYEESIECSQRAIELAKESKDVYLASLALGNVALAALHQDDLSKGLRAAKASVESVQTPSNASEALSRVTNEAVYSRLLLEVENLPKAKERSELAKLYAKQSGSERAELAAAIAEGLYEVHAGLKDVGLSRLEKTLDRARALKSFLRDALMAMVKGYEAAGEPEKALSYLRELMLHTRQAQQENVLYHHSLHLERLEDEGIAVDGAFKKLKKHQDALQGKVAQRTLLQAQLDQLERLAVTAELRDDSTGEHSYRVGKLASLLAQDYGCDDHTCFMVDLAARLHDIGKIGIPDGILLKSGRLTEAERSIMQTHATVGAELLAKSNVPHMQMAEEIARGHHEWWDGTGYPHGIIGRGIPIGARITALADVFDALTHKRPYKEPWPVFKALEEIRRLRGVQFDPELTDLFIPLVQRLQREHGDLDEYLGTEARQSPFIQARQKISETLRRQNDPRFDVRLK
jgi:putative two-component system response regulator